MRSRLRLLCVPLSGSGVDNPAWSRGDSVRWPAGGLWAEGRLSALAEGGHLGCSRQHCDADSLAQASMKRTAVTACTRLTGTVTHSMDVHSCVRSAMQL